MIRSITIGLLLLALLGCESGTVTRSTSPINWKIQCIEGVEYLYRSTGYNGYLSVKFNRDGNVSLCEG